MKILIFDTETTSLDKPFCYDLGYLIYDTEVEQYLEAKDFVIEQAWHNLPLFSTAYYAEKRENYVKLMRSRKAEMTKWGYAMREMARDIKKHNVEACYAFNSSFDDRVFTFNCDWYKTTNPLDTVPVYDIWGYSSQFITNTNEYYLFCEQNQRFTDSGNYSGSAETVTQYLSKDSEFVEDHMALSDSIIELDILLECVKRGAVLNTEYKVNKVIHNPTPKPFTITVNGIVVYEGEYVKKWSRKDDIRFTTL